MNKNLYNACEKAQADILGLTEKLVNMDSGSDDLPELEVKANFLKEVFKSIGADVWLARSRMPAPPRPNPIAIFKGEGKAKILILTHYDTVFPKGEAAKRPYSIKGDKAFGPGVGDMQASLAMLAAGIPIFHTLYGQPYAQLTVFCNGEEETGSQGSRNIIKELAAEHDITLNMELSGDKGDLITVSGRGMANGFLKIKGKAAHSAAEPPAGVNAGLELAYQLLALRDLSNLELRTSVNATMGSFGVKPNIIPDYAEAILNIRFANARECDRVEKEIRERIKNKLFPESEIDFKLDRVFEAYGNTPQIIELADKVRKLAKEELGLELGYRHAIGSNDTSFSSQVCPSLDGFGPGCSRMHSAEETLLVSSLVPRLYILLGTLKEICDGNFVPLDKFNNQIQ